MGNCSCGGAKAKRPGQQAAAAATGEGAAPAGRTAQPAAPAASPAAAAAAEGGAAQPAATEPKTPPAEAPPEQPPKGAEEPAAGERPGSEPKDASEVSRSVAPEDTYCGVVHDVAEAGDPGVWLVGGRAHRCETLTAATGAVADDGSAVAGAGYWVQADDPPRDRDGREHSHWQPLGSVLCTRQLAAAAGAGGWAVRPAAAPQSRAGAWRPQWCDEALLVLKEKLVTLRWGAAGGAAEARMVVRPDTAPADSEPARVAARLPAAQLPDGAPCGLVRDRPADPQRRDWFRRLTFPHVRCGDVFRLVPHHKRVTVHLPPGHGGPCALWVRVRGGEPPDGAAGDAPYAGATYTTRDVLSPRNGWVAARLRWEYVLRRYTRGGEACWRAGDEPRGEPALGDEVPLGAGDPLGWGSVRDAAHYFACPAGPGREVTLRLGGASARIRVPFLAGGGARWSDADSRARAAHALGAPEARLAVGTAPDVGDPTYEPQLLEWEHVADGATYFAHTAAPGEVHLLTLHGDPAEETTKRAAVAVAVPTAATGAAVLARLRRALPPAPGSAEEYDVALGPPPRGGAGADAAPRSPAADADELQGLADGAEVWQRLRARPLRVALAGPGCDLVPAAERSVDVPVEPGWRGGDGGEVLAHCRERWTPAFARLRIRPDAPLRLHRPDGAPVAWRGSAWASVAPGAVYHCALPAKEAVVAVAPAATGRGARLDRVPLVLAPPLPAERGDEARLATQRVLAALRIGGPRPDPSLFAVSRDGAGAEPCELQYDSVQDGGLYFVRPRPRRLRLRRDPRVEYKGKGPFTGATGDVREFDVAYGEEWGGALRARVEGAWLSDYLRRVRVDGGWALRRERGGAAAAPRPVPAAELPALGYDALTHDDVYAVELPPKRVRVRPLLLDPSGAGGAAELLTVAPGDSGAAVLRRVDDAFAGYLPPRAAAAGAGEPYCVVLLGAEPPARLGRAEAEARLGYAELPPGAPAELLLVWRARLVDAASGRELGWAPFDPPAAGALCGARLRHADGGAELAAAASAAGPVAGLCAMYVDALSPPTSVLRPDDGVTVYVDAA